MLHSGSRYFRGGGGEAGGFAIGILRYFSLQKSPNGNTVFLVIENIFAC